MENWCVDFLALPTVWGCETVQYKQNCFYLFSSILTIFVVFSGLGIIDRETEVIMPPSATFGPSISFLPFLLLLQKSANIVPSHNFDSGN